MRTRAYACICLAALCRLALLAGAQTPAAPPERPPVTTPAATAPAVTPPATAPAATPAASQPLDPQVDKILTRLEERDVRDLRARLSWSQRYLSDTEEDATTKNGEIWYLKDQPVARFLIQFHETISGSRKDKLDERHLFDGQWYVALNSRTKTIERREIRKPTDPGDPYRVGQGVFAVPFGQKKSDILAEFSVALVPPADGDPPDTDHLRLTPRPGTDSARKYQQLDFWIAREGQLAGLPIQVRAANKSGTGQLDSYITTSFLDAKLNQGLSRSLFEIKTPAGFEELVERLEEAAPPPKTP